VWVLIEPLPPAAERRSTHPGPKRLDDRQVPQGILFVLHTGTQWEFLPQAPSIGSDDLPAPTAGTGTKPAPDGGCQRC
jgi:hypothetical protein